MQAQIITAYAYSSKSRVFTVGAYVLESHCDGLPYRNTFKVLFNYAVEEDKAAARAKCLARIYKDNERHSADMVVIDRGRVSIDRLKGMAF